MRHARRADAQPAYGEAKHRYAVAAPIDRAEGGNEKRAARARFCLLLGGEGGIRTLGTETVRLISSQVHSTTLPPLRSVEPSIVAGSFAQPLGNRKNYLTGVFQFAYQV